ncbi:cobalamin biosynthesis protein [Tunturiibacter psychrotolerans]|jgi:cobalt-precorrin 5A hydrolase|uniref:cobalamin biosynthesis protein n=1 Tax=Tunturiibacter psychrotolerans TaxID=3069686 RepID=UPI003D21129C
MSLSCSIGIGCSSRAVASDVIQLIQLCVSEIAPDSVVATLDRCSSIAEAVAAVLGLRLVLFPASVLSHIRGVQSHSLLAASTVGTANVAEAAALASLGPAARLILPRQTGRFCTCAVAVLS